MSPSTPLLAAIEAGGTKFMLALGTGPDDLRETTRIPTTRPDETMAAVVAWFQEARGRHGKFAALGVGTFGPAGLQPGAADYGFITTTPKPHWAHTDLLGPLRQAFGVPMAFDTDVNAAALGESIWGAGQGCDPLVYLTVGTGIGGGVMVHGRPLHGLLHPEMGHLRIPSASPAFAGHCPWHGDCLEGLASGPAIAARWGQAAESLPPDHPAWQEIASHLAAAALNILVTLSPKRLIMGGGVLQNDHLLPRVRQHLGSLLNGYLDHPALQDGFESWLTAPGLGTRSGILGAIALAASSLEA